MIRDTRKCSDPPTTLEGVKEDDRLLKAYKPTYENDAEYGMNRVINDVESQVSALPGYNKIAPWSDNTEARLLAFSLGAGQNKQDNR